MYYIVIASGSKGNATVVVSNKTVVLIDFGITLKRMNEGLAEIGLNFNDINGAIFTHNHSDHIQGLKFLSPKKTYALEGTLPSSLSNIVYNYVSFNIGDIKITPFPTSHDAKNPCGFVLESDDEKLVYLTDTGVVLDEAYHYIHDPTYLIIESNHDIKMELLTNRSWDLKKRILSEKGHLCNEDSAFAACKIIGENTKEIVLAHISLEANTPALALEAYNNVFNFNNIDKSKFTLKCANQFESLIGGSRNEN